MKWSIIFNKSNLLLRNSLRFILVILIISIFVSAIQLILFRHYNRIFLGELQSLLQQQDELNITYGQLQLEYSTLTQASRLKKIARNKLDMIIPHSEDIIIIKP
ncbi:MAG: cell division protein FtsL [Thiomargarita sp.]|nr:cell division protein FtsL [Thiomargarita sp.]